CQQVYSKPLTF
nr:immunoglobulin light chain junction region [Macaca mulatta]